LEPSPGHSPRARAVLDGGSRRLRTFERIGLPRKSPRGNSHSARARSVRRKGRRDVYRLATLCDWFSTPLQAGTRAKFGLARCRGGRHVVEVGRGPGHASVALAERAVSTAIPPAATNATAAAGPATAAAEPGRSEALAPSVVPTPVVDASPDSVCAFESGLGPARRYVPGPGRSVSRPPGLAAEEVQHLVEDRFHADDLILARFEFRIGARDSRPVPIRSNEAPSREAGRLECVACEGRPR
jgi:hypothetical protein